MSQIYDAQPSTRDVLRDSLAAAQEAFLTGGGQVEVLEGFSYKPLPPARHPAALPKQPAQMPRRQNKTAKAAEELREYHAPRVVSLFHAGASLTEIGRRTGICRHNVVRILEERQLL